MKLYGGIDLHSTNMYLVLVNETGVIVYSKRLPNNLERILSVLNRFEGIESLVIESTYNWYWLVDGLMAANKQVKLANPNAIQQYNGLKHTGDDTDAHWLAELNRLNIVSEGYIYPKEQRGIRDLLRKRSQLVQQRTAHILSLGTIIHRSTSIRLSANQIKQLTEEQLMNHLGNAEVFLAASSNWKMMNCLEEEIVKVEKSVSKKVRLHPTFKKLLTVSGIGKILALTIMLETGDISRFKAIGNYVSYCRCVNSERQSNGKKKGENNRKNGNKYLCWAYVEAANFAIRHNEVIKSYYQRKMKKRNKIVAIKTVAHKLARACYYVIREQEDFDVNKAFT